MEKTIQFHLEDFTGPLDLLLALVAKNKMSIYDIEILTLIDQYLEIVGEPGPDMLDSTSEFITMAARLVQMKSSLLLPRSEEADRMREELTGLLVEYGACKRVAETLREMAKGVYIAVRRPLAIEVDTTYHGSHDAAQLAEAFTSIRGRSAARRVPRAEQFDEIVAAPFVSVGGRVIHLLRSVVTGRAKRLKELFAHCRSRGETVATFLALLELIRGGRLEISPDESVALNKTTAHPRKEAPNGT